MASFSESKSGSQTHWFVQGIKAACDISTSIWQKIKLSIEAFFEDSFKSDWTTQTFVNYDLKDRVLQMGSTFLKSVSDFL